VKIKYNFKLNFEILLWRTISIFLITLFFTNLVHLPVFNNKIQLSELIFVILILIVPLKKTYIKFYINHKNLSFLFFLFILLDLINLWRFSNLNTLLECIGKIYLISLSCFCYYLFSNFTFLNIINLIRKIFVFSTFLIFLNLLFGLYQLYFYSKSDYFVLFNNYPYFGNVYRFRSLTIHPNMLNNIMSVFTLFFIGTYDFVKFKWVHYITLILSFVIILLTFSKSIPLFLMGFIILFLIKFYKIKKIYINLIIIFFLMLQIITSHLIFAPKKSNIKDSLKSTDFSSDKILFESTNLYIIETGYLSLKKIELDIFFKNPILGIGSGQFNTKLNYYKKINYYPKKMPNFDPHSTYFGILAENGIFQFIILIAIIFYFYFYFISLDYLFTNIFVASLFLIFIIFIIEGISTDILNFRHFWVLLSLILYFFDNHKFKNQFSIHG